MKAADAAQIAAGVCDLEVDPVTTLAETTDADGTEQSVCTNSLGSVLIQQNGPGQSGERSGPRRASGQADPGQSGDGSRPRSPRRRGAVR